MISNEKVYHFIGIGGIGMSALAHILLDRKVKVTGSDVSLGANVKNLVRKGGQCWQGHSKDNIADDVVVVYSSGIPGSNVEYLEALNKKLPLIHRSELLASLMEGSESILVSGSHGKTTTSSLIAAIFTQAGKDPSFAIGGNNHNMINGKAGNSKYFIAEADESDGSLKSYKPHSAVITNLDYEHLVNYDHNINNLGKAFYSFMEKVSDKTKLFYNGDCPLLQQFKPSEGISFGFSSHNDLVVSDYRCSSWNSVFSFNFLEKTYESVTLALPGKHNVLNAAAAFGLALSYGIEESLIREALENFSGVKKRLEKKPSSEKIILLDDYAHHPKEIFCSISAVREAIGERRLVAVCQPHRYSRVADCKDAYEKVFDEADVVIFTDIYSAGETPIPGICSKNIVDQINKRFFNKAFYVPRSELVAFLKNNLQVHDVCLTMGAGDVSLIHDELADYEVSKLKVGLIFGGKSLEHQISTLSARNVYNNLDPNWYEVTAFAIDREGNWIPGAQDVLEGEDIDVPLGKGDTPLASSVASQLAQCDMFFPVLHGLNGEDGSLQGFFEVLGKPYTGPSIAFSSLCIDKLQTKQLVASAGIPIVPYKDFSQFRWIREKEVILEEITSSFAFPMFVKAVHLGSSLGIYEVNNIEELYAGVDLVFSLDTRASVEEKVSEAKEVEFACLGGAEELFCSVARAISRNSHGRFIDYNHKYGLNGVSSFESICDSQIGSQEILQEGKELAKSVYKILGGVGCCRIDFFLTKEGKYLFSEVNTIPGMTMASTFPKAFAREGMDMKRICHKLISEGLYRCQIKKVKGVYS
ncbi:UDP-N-acetylmuramate--L-alanine ligase [Chlamydiifrater phoenicopteri]|uniref:UDP-N-acetylmuramate--L-alanine ligase n=1 Tax=Chlamydiifrater phoenicopteri TaxID=2681469 RepID=UPI001BCDF2E7|nr:UDP-N-acetylmuramate--L-alanine ligase [Chlamydiifrater phoenicopteri]